MSGAPEDRGFDRGYCCAVANILRTHGDSLIARDVLRANEPGDWNDIDTEDRDIIEQFKIKSNLRLSRNSSIIAGTAENTERRR